MRFVPAILLCALLDTAYSEEHFKRPVPYGGGKIYVLGSAQGAPKLPSASYVREHASKIISLGGPAGEADIVNFWDYLRWENSRSDPKIKQRAGSLTMVIDLYDRVQPQSPKKPRFDTLYCTKTFVYSDESDYLRRKPPVSTHLDSFLRE